MHRIVYAKRKVSAFVNFEVDHLKKKKMMMMVMMMMMMMMMMKKSAV